MESSCYEQVYVALASAASGSFSEEQCQALKDLHMLIDNYATSPYRGVLVGCLIQIIVTIQQPDNTNCRLMGVLFLKNLISKHWRSNRYQDSVQVAAINDDEKLLLKRFLCGYFDEAASKVASQIAILAANVSLYDCPSSSCLWSHWTSTELIPAIVTCLSANIVPSDQFHTFPIRGLPWKRGLHTLQEVMTLVLAKAPPPTAGLSSVICLSLYITV